MSDPTKADEDSAYEGDVRPSDYYDRVLKADAPPYTEEDLQRARDFLVAFNKITEVNVERLAAFRAEARREREHERARCIYCDDTARRIHPVCYNHRQMEPVQSEREACERIVKEAEQHLSEISVICQQESDPADAANESAKLARMALAGLRRLQERAK